MMIGFTIALPPSLARSTSAQEPEFVFSPIFTVASREEDALQNTTIMLAPKSSDGDFSNWRSKNTSRRIRKEMDLKSMPESFQMKEEEL